MVVGCAVCSAAVKCAGQATDGGSGSNERCELSHRPLLPFSADT